VQQSHFNGEVIVFSTNAARTIGSSVGEEMKFDKYFIPYRKIYLK
jgi:hypothetical protein